MMSKTCVLKHVASAEVFLQSLWCTQVFHRMHMVFGSLFILFMLMHDIKLWIYAVPGERRCSRQPAGPHHGEICHNSPVYTYSPARTARLGDQLTIARVTSPSCMMGLYGAAGVLFYLLDLQLRLVQRSQPVQLRALATAGHEGLVALQLHADSRWPMRPIQASFCALILMQLQPQSRR